MTKLQSALADKDRVAGADRGGPPAGGRAVFHGCVRRSGPSPIPRGTRSPTSNCGRHPKLTRDNAGLGRSNASGRTRRDSVRAPRPAFGVRRAAGGGLLLERKDIVLSMCMIARDNNRTIGPALESIRPWVDEMVVVDTGSRDDTPAIVNGSGPGYSTPRGSTISPPLGTNHATRPRQMVILDGLR